jgi:hypothetical protein
VDIKQKLLVVEASSHYQVIGQLYHLYKSKGELTFYIVSHPALSTELIDQNNTNVKIIYAKIKGLLLFFKVLRIAHRYDLINISTGPEGDHISDTFNILCFYLTCKLYGRKIILTIRNIRPYLRSTSGIFSCIRNKAIKKLGGITFETQTMRREFNDSKAIPNANTSVIYFRYSDTNPYVERQNYLPSRNDHYFKIGLLGAVDTQRRNYGILFETLESLPSKLLRKIEIVVLGRCLGAEAVSIITRLRSHVRVVQVNPVISEEELTLKGMRCQVLLAPLRIDMDYGTLKGTGAVADAIYLRKPLILPSTVDIQREFKAFCYYYNTASELSDLLQDICEKRALLQPAIFNKYTVSNVLSQLSKDLELFSTSK